MIEATCGSWPAARDELLAAVDLFDHLGPVEQCSTLITLGLAELSLRALDEAAGHLERARETAAEHGLDAHLFKATHNLGCVHFVAGEVPRALTLMAEADAMTVEVARARAQLDHAEALLDAGLADEAAELLRTALDAARAAGHRLDEGDILLDLARCAVLRDDVGTARRHARQAVAAFRTRQAGSRRSLAELFLAGLDLAEGRSPHRAVEAAAAWRTAVPRSAEEVEAALLTAEAQIALGHPGRAEEELTRLRLGGPLRLPVQIHEHYLRAVIAHTTGDERGFAATAGAASEALASAQSAVQSLELRAAMAQHCVRLAQLDLARAVESGSPGAAIDTIERWRAASARGQALSLSPDPRVGELLHELRWLSSPLGPSAGADAKQDAERAARVAALQREIAALSRRSDSVSPSAPVLQTMTHDRLTGLLPRSTAYVAFAETGGRMYAVLTRADGTAALRSVGSHDDVSAAVATARRDLRGAAFAARDPALASVVRRALADSCRRLDDVLLGPLQAELDDCERLVIAPNVTVHAVPWLALPRVGHRPVVVTPSATRWAGRGTERRITVRTVSAHGGPGLLGVAEEVRGIGRTWADAGAHSTATVTATSDGVARALASDDIVHVAAHGRHAGDNPLFSSLRLHDGPLFAHELVGTVRAGHVVLSACDIGQARVRVGGEALGLTSALLAFGVRSVVAAVAPIADEASALASVRYHERLAAGLDVAAALAHAVRETPGAEALLAFGSDLAVYPPRLPSPGTSRRSATASDS